MLSFGASLFFESEIGHMEAKYEFEAGNLDKAFEPWQNLVQQKGVGNNAILLSRRAIISKGVDYVMD